MVKGFIASKRTTIFTHEIYIGSCIPAESKISITSFVHQLIEIFYFLDEDLDRIFKLYKINHLYLYLLFTDTDSCSIQYVTQMEKEVDYTDKEIQFTLKGYVAKKMSERLDKIHPFYKQFDLHKPEERKDVGLFAQDDPQNEILVSMQSGPKEYYFLQNNALEEVKKTCRCKGIKKIKMVRT